MLARASEILHELDVKVYGFVFNGVDASLPEYYGYLAITPMNMASNSPVVGWELSE